MAAPQGVCIAFAANTLDPDPAVWTRLDDPSAYGVVSGWSISRGRPKETEKTNTGTANLNCLDRQGLLDPMNGSSPFHGNLDPMKQAAISIKHPITGAWWTLFRGFVSRYDHELETWGTRGLDTISIELADAFDYFAAAMLMPGVHGVSIPGFGDVYYAGTPSNLGGQSDVFKHVDDRIKEILADFGWPVALQNIFSGNVSLQGVVYSRSDSPLSALWDAADSEFPGVANLFVSKNGIVIFHGRDARFNWSDPQYGINTWHAGGLPQAQADSTVAPITDLKFRRTKEDIINACLCLPRGASDTDAEINLLFDNPSITKYGYRGMSITELLTSAGHDAANNPTTNLEECRRFADYYVGNYASPRTVVETIRFQTRDIGQVGASALWDLICAIEIGDVIHLNTSHPGGGGFNEGFFVENLRYDAQPLRGSLLDITLDVDVSPMSSYGYNPFT